MPQHYSDPRRESDEHALPNIETFRVPQDVTFSEMALAQDRTGHDYDVEPGWYYWSCFPGCLPDGDPIGPFATEAEALADAREGMESNENDDRH